jgi:hypothetical protein
MFATKADFEETVFLLAANIFMFWCVYMFLEMITSKPKKKRQDNRLRRVFEKNTDMFNACADHYPRY